MAAPSPSPAPLSLGAAEGAVLTGTATVSVYIATADPFVSYVSPLADAVIRVSAIFLTAFCSYLGYKAWKG